MAVVDDNILEDIKKDLKDNHSALYLDAFLNIEARKLLKGVLRESHPVLLSDDDRLEYVVQETVGLGLIEDILKKYPLVTDISYNATDLKIETPEEKFTYEGVEEDYVIKIIQKFANAVGKEFTPKDPILDASLSNLRINAVHKVNSPYGTTMSIRVTRQRLALSEDNFKNFAPMYILDLFNAMITVGSNVLISGETGTGKTELQKLLVGYTLDYQKIITIEDTAEGHYKDLYPEKDITSWVTTNSIHFTDLIKAALRNNPDWINVSEVRGKEAYEMIQSALSGHRIITTLHSINARATPSRIIDMVKEGHQVDEKALSENIYRYFNFGIHIKRKRINGKMVRYLSEIVEYLEGEKTNTVFEMKVRGDKFTQKIGVLSDDFKDKLIEFDLDYEGLPKEELQEN
ncbi:CpaF/VirB11 family protein [Paraclostridium bifermentans]|uniref:CpaF/VirB11 family protein n=1 Tax=Paraclostridium bifermentans TaxID=1490 RepID=UPI00189AC183|nr:CpaF/VirB11 family protein [Paraclostridium bifermentans]